MHFNQLAVLAALLNSSAAIRLHVMRRSVDISHIQLESDPKTYLPFNIINFHISLNVSELAETHVHLSAFQKDLKGHDAIIELQVISWISVQGTSMSAFLLQASRQIYTA